MDAWPFRHLVLRTPRLELRPDDDEGLLELVEQAHDGVHPPDQMPFGVGWTDTPAADLGRTMLQHHWHTRAVLHAAKWTLNFLVRLDGRVIGTQGIGADDFAVAGEVHTGSWVGLRHQGRGIGTEMRAAVLLFAFDHLGARSARSSAWSENAKSLGVSRKLGYVEDGTQRVTRRGQASDDVRLLLTHDRFIRPAWSLEVAGLSGCLGLLTQGEPAE